MTGASRSRRQPDWSAELDYKPAPSTALLRCRCGAVWYDDKPGRAAHMKVFGHRPSTTAAGPAPREVQQEEQSRRRQKGEHMDQPERTLADPQRGATEIASPH